MPTAPAKPAASAELALVQLKSCLVNLPSPLVSVLLNANAIAQNVVVELQYRQLGKSSSGISSQRAVYTGWTGIPSQRRLSTKGAKEETSVVEIDTAFARTLGLSEGQKVSVFLHVDPPMATTVNIEPVTTADWEIIELHVNFLEINLLNQIRALPNPSFNATPSSQSQHFHPLTIHMSPTSTANILVTGLSPAPPSTSPFAKISPNAEVIVAPKTRPRFSRSDKEDRRSIAGSRRSVGGRSTTSTVRQKNYKEERPAMFLRGVDREIAGEWFDKDDEQSKNKGLKIWVDEDVLLSKSLRGTEYACVTIINPAGLQPPVDPQQQLQHQEPDLQDAPKPTLKLIAKLVVWPDPPDGQHVALSSALCTSLQAKGLVGGLVKLEASIPQVSKSSVKSLKIYPFNSSKPTQATSLIKFGGESKAALEAAQDRIKALFDEQDSPYHGLWSGPITDGIVLPASSENNQRAVWNGGLMKFNPPLTNKQDPTKTIFGWLVGKDHNLNIEMQPEISKPKSLITPTNIPEEPIPDECPVLVGIDSLIADTKSHLTHSSSVLLTGGLGSGKTSLSIQLAHQLRKEKLYNITYLPCRKLVNDETRVSTIKDTLNRLLMSAAWCARGGQSIVILDDLDRLCPVETELQVGGENGRSRQISEIFCSLVRQHCDIDSGIVLLITAQGKESLNNVLVGGHIVREIINLKAPNKDSRRRVLELLTKADQQSQQSQQQEASRQVPNGTAKSHSRKSSYERKEPGWLDPSDNRPESPESEHFYLDQRLDFLDIAGQTDGYMPGDLLLLVSRARSEALIRSIEEAPNSTDSTAISLCKDDFDKALKGFTPASLRNVTLQSSTTTFDSIGGLHATRKTLLETLQYPTTYAPIFAQCPLRLRSGLLLYGYPGCGKTLLASAVAGECGLNFISVKGPEILNKYIGASEKSVRDLFERAEAAKPCVLFFDEFDSIAPKRGHDSTGVTDRVVNQLLTQMDGAEGLSGVYVLAATSRPDLIDPALLRPGRLDKSLFCGLPDLDERLDILQALSKKLHLDNIAYQGLEEVARTCPGYSGADLQAVIYNAHLEAVHDILGDHSKQKEMNGDSTAKSGGEGSTDPNKINPRSFLQFRYGEEEEKKHAAGMTPSKELAERAAIAAKIQAQRDARRKQHLLLSGKGDNEKAGRGNENNDDKTNKSPEVVISWKHIQASLATTRGSISPEERRRLGNVYREFVTGRNGEMPNGQGSMEIGGRSSLM